LCRKGAIEVQKKPESSERFVIYAGERKKKPRRVMEEVEERRK